ncbi:MAG: HAD family hydrolase [Candidatus Thorarchaeota archaeon]
MPFKALLIDFDNTLVLFNEDQFLLSYARLAYPYLADFFDESTFFQKLLQSTLHMIHNDGSMINVEAFTKNFIADTPELSYNECYNRFQHFYEEAFNQLGSIVKVVPHGRQLLVHAINEGLQIVIASNPIFPKIANQIRLRWANLHDLEIALTTDAENMSFCKPRPEYYKAILEYINLQPKDCIMAGNDPISDMSASALGIKTFLIDLDQEKGRLGILSKEVGNSAKKNAAASQYQVDGSGTLEELEQYLFSTKRR